MKVTVDIPGALYDYVVRGEKAAEAAEYMNGALNRISREPDGYIAHIERETLVEDVIARFGVGINVSFLEV